MSKFVKLHERIRALFHTEGEKFCYSPGETQRLVSESKISPRIPDRESRERKRKVLFLLTLLIFRNGRNQPNRCVINNDISFVLPRGILCPVQPP